MEEKICSHCKGIGESSLINFEDVTLDVSCSFCRGTGLENKISFDFKKNKKRNIDLAIEKTLKELKNGKRK